MNTEIKNSILTTDKDAQYDESAKRLLGQKNILEHIHLVKESIVNLHAWKGTLDLINIVIIGLSEDLPSHEEKYELHKLLGALLSQIYL